MIEGGLLSGTWMVISRCFVARRVRVHREPVRERMVSRRRSCTFDRKLKTKEGVGSDWAAKRTVWQSSLLATAATAGSEEASIFTA